MTREPPESPFLEPPGIPAAGGSSGTPAAGESPGTPAAGGSPDGGLPGRVIYTPAGLWAGLLASGPLARLLPEWHRQVRIDFDAGAISQGATTLPFPSIRVLELRGGVFGASDGERWICFDPRAYRDRGGPVQDRNGNFSGSFIRILQALQGRVAAGFPGGEQAAPPARFELRYGVRVDVGSIVFSLAGVGVYLGYQHFLREDIGISITGLTWFLGILGICFVLFCLWRWTSSVTLDDGGIELRRPFWRRYRAWSAVTGLRLQGLEVEIEGDGFRLPLNLDLLRGPGSRIILHRGLRPLLTPFGSRFIQWLRGMAAEVPEAPIFGSRAERWQGRWWAVVLVALNAALLYLSWPISILGRPTDEELRKFYDRLIDLGARTENSFEEPRRFLASLFLHGDPLHFGFNMLILAMVAPWICRIFGWWRATLLYLGSGVLGNVLAQAWLAVVARDSGPHMSVGASTAILGIIGSLLGAIYRRPHSVPLVVRARFRWAIPVVFLLTIGLGLVIPIMDNGAHIGGFLAGLALVWIIPPLQPARVPARDGAG